MLKKALSKITHIFSNLYIHKYPFFILYKPEIHKIKGDEVRKIIEALEPGDLIFRKHSGWVGSMLIPGYWSHVALYCGNDKVIHAIGEGVIEEDILTFCRTDNISIKRIENVKTEEIDSAINIAKKMVSDKIEYDYSFKDDNGKIYCTEMINLCYNNLFESEYVRVVDMHVLIPDLLYLSLKLNEIIEFTH